MKKIFSLFALMLFSLSILAQTFTPTSEASMTQNGVTVSFDKGSGNNAPTWYENGLRLYASNTITVSGAAITTIQLVFTKQGTKPYASLAANTGTLVNGGESTGADDQKTDSWTGSANSVVFTLGTSGQRLIKHIIVNGDTTGMGGGTTGGGGTGGGGTGGGGTTTVTLDPNYQYAEPTVVGVPSTTASAGAQEFVENNIKVSITQGAIYADYFNCYASNSITFTATQPIKAITVDGFIKKDFDATASSGDIAYADASEDKVDDELVLAVTNVDATTLTLSCVKQIGFRHIYFYFEENPDIEIGGGGEIEYSYEWEPKEVTTFNLTMTDVEIEDMVEDLEYKSLYVALWDETNELDMVVFADYDATTGIPVGTYTINDTYDEGTVQASPGADDFYDYESILWADLYEEEGELYGDPYYIVSGTLTVAKTATDFTYTLNGTSYNGSTINVTYTAPLMTAVESVSKPADLNKRLVNGQLIITRGEQRYSVLGNKL